MKRSFFYEHNEEYFQQDIEDTVDSILGKVMPSDQREELIKSISHILDKYEEKYLNYLKFEPIQNENLPIPNNYSNYNQITPTFNIYLLLNPMNPFQPSIFRCYSPSTNTIIPQNPYQMPIVQSQSYIPHPALNYFTQPVMTSTHTSTTSEKSKSTTKKHKHTTKSHTKKHHSKSEKSDQKQKKKFSKTKGHYFKFNKDSERELKGIIRYLTNKCGGNVDEKGVVHVTSSSICNDGNQNSIGFLPKNAVDLDNKDNDFVSRDVVNSWLKYDFINHKVKPTNYTIRSRYKFNCHNPKNWVIEGSNDNVNWIILDSQSDNSDLDGTDLIHTFDIKSEIDESFRYLRIRQNGTNHTHQNYFIFSALEYFGYLY